MASVRILEDWEIKLPEGSCMHMFKSYCLLLAETLTGATDDNTYKWPMHVVGISSEFSG